MQPNRRIITEITDVQYLKTASLILSQHNGFCGNIFYLESELQWMELL